MSVRKYCFCLAFVFMGFVYAPCSLGQQFRGKIQGLVTDQSQAVVPGATVTLLNIKTEIRTVRSPTRRGSTGSITSIRAPTPLRQK